MEESLHLTWIRAKGFEFCRVFLRLKAHKLIQITKAQKKYTEYCSFSAYLRPFFWRLLNQQHYKNIFSSMNSCAQFTYHHNINRFRLLIHHFRTRRQIREKKNNTSFSLGGEKNRVFVLLSFWLKFRFFAKYNDIQKYIPISTLK